MLSRSSSPTPSSSRSSSMTLRSSGSRCATWTICREAYSGENRDGAPLGFEERLFDVAEVLAVGLERRRLIAADRDAVEVVRVQHRAFAHVTRKQRDRRADERPPPQAYRRDQVEPQLEVRLGR